MKKTAFSMLGLAILSVCVACVAAGAPTAILAWGDNSKGLLLTGETSVHVNPVMLSNSSFSSAAIVSISAGQSHVVAVDANGDVFTWGSNNFGQLGNSSFSSASSLSAIQVSSLGPMASETVVQVACSQNSALVLTSSGFLWSWGSNFRGVLGNGTDISVSSYTDVPVWALRNVTAHGAPVWIGCGKVFCGTLTDSNVVLMWGSNENGQLGFYSGSFSYVTIPALVNVTSLGARHFTQLSFGGKHVVALTNDSLVMAWGANTDAQIGVLGLPTSVYWPVFVNFSAANGDFVVQVAAGSAHSMLLTNAGLIYGWGLTQFYQLMDAPAFTDQLYPWPLPLNYFWGKVTSIGACSDSSFATSDHGRFYAWGFAGNYLLGSNTTNNSYGPLKVNVSAALPAPDYLVTSFTSSGFATTAFAITTQTSLPPFTAEPTATPASTTEPPPFNGATPSQTPLAPAFSGGIPTSASPTLSTASSLYLFALLSLIAAICGAW